MAEPILTYLPNWQILYKACYAAMTCPSFPLPLQATLQLTSTSMLDQCNLFSACYILIIFNVLFSSYSELQVTLWQWQCSKPSLIHRRLFDTQGYHTTPFLQCSSLGTKTCGWILHWLHYIVITLHWLKLTCLLYSRYWCRQLWNALITIIGLGLNLPSAQLLLSECPDNKLHILH